MLDTSQGLKGACLDDASSASLITDATVSNELQAPTLVYPAPCPKGLKTLL